MTTEIETSLSARVAGRLELFRAALERSTKGPWRWNTYNEVFDSAGRELFSIPDHPSGDDDYYLPEEIIERSAWYRESEANVRAILLQHNITAAHLDLVEGLLMEIDAASVEALLTKWLADTEGAEKIT